LIDNDFDAATAKFKPETIDRICDRLEKVRCFSQAVRNLNLVSTIREAVRTIGGTVTGVGLHRAVYLHLPRDVDVVVYPAVGVPTSVNLNDAADHAQTDHVGVVYDHKGLHHTWLKHLGWLGDNIKIVRWIKSSEAAWDLADWTT